MKALAHDSLLCSVSDILVVFRFSIIFLVPFELFFDTFWGCIKAGLIIGDFMDQSAGTRRMILSLWTIRILLCIFVIARKSTMASFSANAFFQPSLRSKQRNDILPNQSNNVDVGMRNRNWHNLFRFLNFGYF